MEGEVQNSPFVKHLASSGMAHRVPVAPREEVRADVE